MSKLRETRRVCWDGPNPHPGDYLAARGGGWWLIQSVRLHRAIGSADGDVTLALLRDDAVAPHPGAVFHPYAICLASEASGPPRVRQVAGVGAAGVMKASWRDPADVVPNASRQPRRITGYRTFCPLRRIAAAPGSRITETHIVAADQFRASWDLARYGRTSSDGGAVGSGFSPSSGPSARCVDQAAAALAVKRALAQFPPAQVPMLVFVLIDNRPMQAWCQAVSKARGYAANPQVEMGRLLTLLDLLAWILDVEDGLADGRLAGVA